MHQALRRALATLAAVALTAGLAACSDDGDATAQPTVTTTATTSAPPASTPRPTPERETAHEFIQRWFDETARMEETGETREFMALVTSACQPCRDLAAYVERIYAAGGWVEAPKRTVTKVTKIQSKDGFHTFDATVEASPSRRKESATAKIINSPAETHRLRFELRRPSGEWVVVLVLGAP